MKLLVVAQTVDKDDPILGFFHGWLCAFASHFSRIDVICLKRGRCELPAHVHVHSLGKEAGVGRVQYTLRFYRYFWQYYMRGEVSYVFFHMGAIFTIMAAPFFLIRTLKGAQFYWWKAHGHINWVGRLALRFCDRVVTSTASGFPIETRKRRIVGQAIDTDLFSLHIDKKNIYATTFVGRVSPIKHIGIALTAIEMVRKSGENATFSIVGPQDDVPAYRDQLCEQVSDAGLSDAVTFVGPLVYTKLNAHYRGTSLFLNPSTTESMDKAVLEAMLCGVIPLTANRAFRELLSPFGLFLKENTPAVYADAIQKLGARSPRAIAELRAQLHEVVATHHALSTFTNRIFEIR